MMQLSHLLADWTSCVYTSAPSCHLNVVAFPEHISGKRAAAKPPPLQTRPATCSPASPQCLARHHDGVPLPIPTHVFSYLSTRFLISINLQVDPPAWRLAAQKLLRHARSGPQLAEAQAAVGESKSAAQNPITGLYEIRPAVEGRIRNLQEARAAAGPDC